MLQERARKAAAIPLGEYVDETSLPETQAVPDTHEDSEAEGEGEEGAQPRRLPRVQKPPQAAFSISTAASQGQRGARSPEYQRVLDRYIPRLVTLNQFPTPPTVCRQNPHRNPTPPALFEKL